jgi:Rhodopirellula transposase DDE domain
MREQFSRQNFPIISVDTKKRELVGNFKNSGRRWESSPTFVNDHDFPSWATGYAIPYSIYDILYNRGSVFVGTSHDTAAFAVSSIRSWWCRDGRIRYPYASQLLILADAGGSNRPGNLWKDHLQRFLCDRFHLSVTVCHFPTGASKWNPTEHRLLSEISKNWSGQPLTDYDTILNLIRSTTTRSGLKVKAYLDTRSYSTGLKPLPHHIDQLNLTSHDTLPRWNYTLASNTM